MSEELKIECSLCGLEGGSVPHCGTCSGKAQNQTLAYTLSDHRSGRAPKEDDRYGNDGGLNPKSPDLPGAAYNHPYGRQ